MNNNSSSTYMPKTRSPPMAIVRLSKCYSAYWNMYQRSREATKYTSMRGKIKEHMKVCFKLSASNE